jgi:hypothetical protein
VENAIPGNATIRINTVLRNTTTISPDLQPEVDRLINASLSGNTQKNYKAGIESFVNFCSLFGSPLTWPPIVQQITEYIAYMSMQQYTHATIRCYISAISYVNKLNCLVDNTKQFIVSRMLEGLRRLNNARERRQPITVVILRKLIN